MNARVSRRSAIRRAATLSIGVLMLAVDVAARGQFNGRAILTYQDSDVGAEAHEMFSQRYEGFLRDRLWEDHNVRLSFYFNDAKNLSIDRTFRAYRGDMDLSHRYYRLNLIYSPRQTTSALQLSDKTERTFKQSTLDLFVPQGPRMRFFYADRSQYNNGAESSRIRDLRGDMNYQYKILYLALNRWNSRQTNGNDNETNVTGGTIRLTKTYRMFHGRIGYDHQLTETTPEFGLDRSVSNRNLSGQISGHHRGMLSATFSFNTRWQTAETETMFDAKSRNENYLGWLVMFPASPVRLELGRNYIRQITPTNSTLLDYATVQLIAQGRVAERIIGQAQIAQRFDVNSDNGIIPSDLYFFSVRGNAYPGVDFRAEVNVNRRNIIVLGTRPYQMSSLLDLHLVPRRNLRISPSVQFLNTSDNFTMWGNDRITYGLIANYFPGRGLTLGGDLRRSVVTVGRQQTANSGSVNATLNLRSRTSLQVSYAVNRVHGSALPDGTILVDDGGGDTFNILAQTMVTQRGTVSVNFSNISQYNGRSDQFMSVSYRQEF